MRKAVYTIISIIAVFFATLVASSACLFYCFQPEEPHCLSDK